MFKRLPLFVLTILTICFCNNSLEIATKALCTPPKLYLVIVTLQDHRFFQKIPENYPDKRHFIIPNSFEIITNNINRLNPSLFKAISEKKAFTDNNCSNPENIKYPLSIIVNFKVYYNGLFLEKIREALEIPNTPTRIDEVHEYIKYQYQHTIDLLVVFANQEDKLKEILRLDKTINYFYQLLFENWPEQNYIKNYLWDLLKEKEEESIDIQKM